MRGSFAFSVSYTAASLMRRSFLIFLLTLLLFSIGQVGCRPTSESSNSNNANVSRSPLQDNNGSSSAARITFDPSCRLPFQEIKGENLPIDQQCSKDGTATHDSSNAKQNEVKNNFCATGVPVKLTFANFDQLQETADIKNIPYGSPRSLDDRSILAGIITVNNQPIGEGSVVTLVGFVFDARHSNTKFFNEEGESVNCKSGELGMNDIHIELAESADLLTRDDECKTVTAEISPHFRPASWDRLDVNPKTTQAAHGLPLQRVKVRISGQLFFDASHKPCINGEGRTPRRRSIWEIHPVYAIDVFDEAKRQFITLDEWARDK